VIVILVLIHLILLHNTGSSNPHGTNTEKDKITFIPYFIVKDLIPGMIIALIIRILISITPDILGDPENFNQARITTTPTHIKPEWYFFFFCLFLFFFGEIKSFLFFFQVTFYLTWIRYPIIFSIILR
jgi:ubiquinol-cytochrome c reductase cytochrome b subunit